MKGLQAFLEWEFDNREYSYPWQNEQLEVFPFLPVGAYINVAYNGRGFYLRVKEYHSYFAPYPPGTLNVEIRCEVIQID